MSALRNPGMSDILAATGKAGMNEPVAEKFWTWRRMLLAVGYGLVLVTGLQIVLAADPTGLILVAAALTSDWFITALRPVMSPVTSARFSVRVIRTSTFRSM